MRPRVRPWKGAGLDPDDFVRQALGHLESDFREMALVALGEWEATGLISPSLFQAIASLQRP